MKYNPNTPQNQVMRALGHWRQHSQPGDVARGSLLGRPVAKAYYGAETPQFICDVFTSFVGEADFVLVNCYGEQYAAMRCSFFEMIGGAA